MENDEKTDETHVEEKESHTEEVKPETTEEEKPVPDAATEEKAELTVEQKLALAQAEAAKYRRLLEKANKTTVKTETKSPSPANVEETVLRVNGMADELIEELKAVAAVRKTSLIKAQSDPIFVALKEKFEKDQKQKEAGLPASKNAGAAKAQKSFLTPGLSRDEHREMVRQAVRG